MSKKVCIITARGGSKRIPRKNIRDFCGKPIIAYSIEKAFASKLFDEVMVSTDDAEITEIAKKYGAKVPFQRSAQNSNDFATTANVLSEVVLEYKKLGLEFSHLCCIYPTAPLLNVENLVKAWDILNKTKVDCVFPVVKFGFPIQRALKMKSNGLVEMFHPENYNTRSQDLEPAYQDAGQFYFMDTKQFMLKQKLWTDNTNGLILDEFEIQDIDNETDWKMAEFKFNYLKNRVE